MNLIILEDAAAHQRLAAGDRRFAHARGVLQVRPGDSFVVGLADGPVGRATVTSVTDSAMEVAVEWGDRPEPPPPVTLLLGMCRPAVARRILQTLPTLGVRRLFLFSGGRSDPAYARSSLWEKGEWRGHVLEGLEQAYDTWVPEVALFSDLRSALEAVEPGGVRVALDVYAQAGWVAVERGRPRTACLAVGSERGWNTPEREALEVAQFLPVALLGGRVMRCETAVIAGLSLLHERCGWLEERPRWEVATTGGGPDVS